MNLSLMGIKNIWVISLTLVITILMYFMFCTAMQNAEIIVYMKNSLLATFSNSNNFVPVESKFISPNWKNLDESTGTQIMDYFMWTNRSSCRLAHDFGGTMMNNPSGMDGQKTVCIDPNVAPQGHDCLVYSFGINNEWSFDENMERYGCQVYSFDPSMGAENHDHSKGIHFYNWGLGNQDEMNENNWKIFTLSTIYQNLTTKHGQKIIDYLKMDVESAEWTALPQIIESGMLANVRQLGAEFHLPVDDPIENYRAKAKILRSLELMGMVRFDSKYNPWFMGNFAQLGVHGSRGYEIVWYNSKILQVTY